MNYWQRLLLNTERQAVRKKTAILNEFIASTDYKRKHAIRLLCMRKILSAKTIKRPRARYYVKEVEEVLLVAWGATNYIASKRLAPFLEELVPALQCHGHLNLTEEVRSQFISISPETIDRILRPCRRVNIKYFSYWFGKDIYRFRPQLFRYLLLAQPFPL